MFVRIRAGQKSSARPNPPGPKYPLTCGSDETGWTVYTGEQTRLIKACNSRLRVEYLNPSETEPVRLLLLHMYDIISRGLLNMYRELWLPTAKSNQIKVVHSLSAYHLNKWTQHLICLFWEIPWFFTPSFPTLPFFSSLHFLIIYLSKIDTTLPFSLHHHPLTTILLTLHPISDSLLCTTSSAQTAT